MAPRLMAYGSSLTTGGTLTDANLERLGARNDETSRDKERNDPIHSFHAYLTPKGSREFLSGTTNRIATNPGSAHNLASKLSLRGTATNPQTGRLVTRPHE
jgi:hypothetical protein